MEIEKRTLRLVLGDQLSRGLAGLKDADPRRDTIIMAEVIDEATYAPHHPQKIILIFSAMRHFAEDLRREGFEVIYRKLDDDGNQGSIASELQAALHLISYASLIITKPSEYRLYNALKIFGEEFQLATNKPFDYREDDRFLCPQTEFSDFVGDKKTLRLEYFYRHMRKKTGILMEHNHPQGGQWNYDQENRKSPPKGLKVPPCKAFVPDQITQDVISLVRDRFSHHFGDVDGFDMAVTRPQALSVLDYFCEHLLPQFGDYQDAMISSEPMMFHSRISAALNIGLLEPLEVIKAVENEYHKGRVSLAGTEGFVRQILGWREFVRGIYWHFMPEYGTRNGLKATEPLPSFYWGAPTKMKCISEAVGATKRYAYAHHIQRLMVTGNFALMAGLDVAEVQNWYLAVYYDAFEWVEMPNTLGMALHGDDGVVGSKPYAASGQYINRMSNYCASCDYSPKESVGERACPFNALYWDFFARHEDRFRGLQRIKFVYQNWDRFSPEKQLALRARTRDVMALMRVGLL